jgi:hypothetical protein
LTLVFRPLPAASRRCRSRRRTTRQICSGTRKQWPNASARRQGKPRVDEVNITSIICTVAS